MAKPRFKVRGGQLRLIPNPLPDLASYRALLENPSAVLPSLGEHDYNYSFRYRESAMDFLPPVRVATLMMAAIRRSWSNYAYRAGQYNVESEAYLVTTKIFDLFVREVESIGAEPVIVILPRKYDVVRYRGRGTKIYEPLLGYLESMGYRYVDLMDALGGAT